MPYFQKNPRGVCGADADLTVARNFGRFVAAGAAAHSDHGRDLVETLLAISEGKTDDYHIKDEEKLRRIADEIGVEQQGKDIKDVAYAVSRSMIEDYGYFTNRWGSCRAFLKNVWLCGKSLVLLRAALTVMLSR